MNKGALILIAATSLLAACGGSKKEEATDDLQQAAENTATNLAVLAGKVPDADQANVMVNESLELTNAEQAVDNSEK